MAVDDSGHTAVDAERADGTPFGVRPPETGQPAAAPPGTGASATEPAEAAQGDTGRAAPAEPAEPVELVARLTAIEGAVGEFQRRSAHRETVIDRLHEENQRLRGGLYRSLLDPVVTDLIRMYDSLLREAARLAAAGDEKPARLLESFADDTLLTLERCGLDEFTARPGEPFDAGRHTAASIVPVDDPALDNTVAEVVTAGFADRETGRVRRPVRARFHRHTPAGPPEAAPGPSAPGGAGATDTP